LSFILYAAADLNDATIAPNDVGGDPDFQPDYAAFYDGNNLKYLSGYGTR